MKEEEFQSSIFSQCMLHITRILHFLNIILLYSLKMQLKLKLFNLNCRFTSFCPVFSYFFRIFLGLFWHKVLNFRAVVINHPCVEFHSGSL